MVQVYGMPWCPEIDYHTCTCKTRDLKPAGFPIPVTIPSSGSNFVLLDLVEELDYSIYFSRLPGDISAIQTRTHT